MNLQNNKLNEIGHMLAHDKHTNPNVDPEKESVIDREMTKLNQNLFERKNYLVISSFNNRKTAEIELKEFYQLLRYHLLNIKVSTRLLNNKEILELIYEQLHKGNKNKVSDIEEKGGLDLYVTSKKRKKAKTL